MPQLVRGGLRFNRWLETDGREPAEFPADVITDLFTKGDRLSVFEVDDAAGITAERIAVAVVAGKSGPAETAYSVFDRASVEALGIALIRTPGATIDNLVNGAHYDLRVGTVEKLSQLTGVIAQGEITPILKERVAELLRMGFESGQLDKVKNKQLSDKVKA